MAPKVYVIAGLAIALFAAPACAEDSVLWRDPGRVEDLDFTFGPGGQESVPQPPFTFVKEDMSGSSAKVEVTDANGATWNVKFGPEVHSETFSSRVAWAAGYFVEPTYLIPRGSIQNVRGLQRAAKSIGAGGAFENGRFQLRDPKLKFSTSLNWSWINNPFQDTPQMAGLKIVIMLVSNWDNKDARDVEEGINTAVFERVGEVDPQYIYAFTDWGGSMGHWGNFLRRSVWNCADFAADTPKLVRGIKNGIVEWGYKGRHPGFVKGISASNVQWILRFIGRISEAQFEAGLKASGATPEEAQCFTRELRRRIDRLREAAGSISVTSSSRSSQAAW